MKLPRWLVISLIGISVLAVFAAAAWWWVMWPRWSGQLKYPPFVHWDMVALAAFCCVTVGIGLFRHAFTMTAKRALVQRAAIAMVVTGLVFLVPSTWNLWIETAWGHQRYVDRLVARGDLEGAAEAVASKGTWLVLLDCMDRHQCKDYRVVLDNAVQGPYWLHFLERQMCSDPEYAIDFALAQTDPGIRQAAFRRILSSEGNSRCNIHDDYLIDQRSDFLTAFASMEPFLATGNLLVYSCAKRLAQRSDRIELAHSLLRHIDDRFWRADVLTELATRFIKADDSEGAEKYFREALAEAGEYSPLDSRLFAIDGVATRILQTMGADELRQILSESRALRDSLLEAGSRKPLHSAGEWISLLSRDVYLWRLLGEPDQANRVVNNALEYIESILESHQKKALIDAWEEHQKNVDELRRMP
jgi:hypothetical protein